MEELVKDLEAILAPWVGGEEPDENGIVINTAHPLARQCAMAAQAHFKQPGGQRSE